MFSKENDLFDLLSDIKVHLHYKIDWNKYCDSYEIENIFLHLVFT